MRLFAAGNRVTAESDLHFAPARTQGQSGTKASAANFDRLAAIYRWMEWLTFGPYLWRARTAFLPHMAEARRALVLGDGDGRFTAALLRVNRRIEVDAVDVSRKMLDALLQRASPDSERVTTHVEDVKTWAPPAGAAYDLLVTHFFLDCLTAEDIQALAQRIRPSLTSDARWVISEFAVPAGRFGRWVAQPVVSFLYWAFGMLTGLDVRRLPDWTSALDQAGFRPVGERAWLGGMLTSQLWAPDGQNSAGSKRND